MDTKTQHFDVVAQHEHTEYVTGTLRNEDIRDMADSCAFHFFHCGICSHPSFVFDLLHGFVPSFTIIKCHFFAGGDPLLLAVGLVIIVCGMMIREGWGSRDCRLRDSLLTLSFSL
jgi:hypothetical protein